MNKQLASKLSTEQKQASQPKAPVAQAKPTTAKPKVFDTAKSVSLYDSTGKLNLASIGTGLAQPSSSRLTPTPIETTKSLTDTTSVSVSASDVVVSPVLRSREGSWGFDNRVSTHDLERYVSLTFDVVIYITP